MKNPAGSQDDLRRWGINLFVLGVLLVLAATLFPYNFRFVQIGKVSSSNDFLTAHIILFLLPGFATACICRTGFKASVQLGIILAVGVCLSVVTEGLQIFLPTRSVSFGDALANLTGMFLGFSLFQGLGPRFLNCAAIVCALFSRLLTPRILAASFFGYATLMCSVSISIRHATNLSNWEDFALIVGNEKTGDRPWQGQVYQLQVADRVISKEEVIAAFADGGRLAPITGPLMCSYEFTSGENYVDKSGHLSDLVWQGGDRDAQPDAQPDECARVGPGHWLATTAPAESLIQAIRESSEFTVNVTIATGNTTQHGPARIVSLSGDPIRRNLTLGQEGSDLVVRLRTPLTGENGSNPELIFPDTLVDTKPHQLVVTYDGSNVCLIQDGVRHSVSFQLSPEAALFRHLSPLNANDSQGYKAIFYGLVFVPLGILLARMAAVSLVRSTRRSLMLGLGIVMPSIAFECVLASVSGRPLVEHHLLLGIVLTGSSFVLGYVVSRFA